MWRPRWRSGIANCWLRGKAPSNGVAQDAARAPRISSTCRADPVWLSTTPHRRICGSYISKPLTTAATLSAAERASTTSSTGRSRTRARAAVLAAPPSNSPMTPSTRLTSASSADRSNIRRQQSAPIMNRSRLCDIRSTTIVCRVGSMKSGPHLNGCTASPRRTRAASSPSVSRVLPEPLLVAAMTKADRSFIHPSMTTALHPSRKMANSKAPRYISRLARRMSSASMARRSSPSQGLSTTVSK